MSETRKWWLGGTWFTSGRSSYRKLYTEPDHSESMSRPVIVTPIEDESLPHPGDGREWEGRDTVGRWHPVEILGVPHADPDGSKWVASRWPDGDTDLVDTETLRERKPESEHRPWCKADAKTTWERSRVAGYNVEPLPCACERRSGQERRQGERRNTRGVTWRFVGGRRPNPYEGGYGDLLLGRRSGTDRRSP